MKKPPQKNNARNTSILYYEHVETLLANMNDMISRHDPDTTLLYITPSSERMLGYTPQELLGKTIKFIVSGEKIEDVTKIVKEKSALGADHFHVEHSMIRKDGREIWVETNGRLVYDANGELEEIQCVVRDITARHMIEQQKNEALEALRQSEEKFRGIAEHMRDTIFINDTTGILTYLSPSCEVLFGYRPDEMMGRHFMDYLHESSIPLALERFTTTLDSGIPQKSILLNMKRRDGSLFQGELVANILMHKNVPVGTLGIIRDTTERKEAEDALARALDEKESLLRELQHRVKNSFAIVTGMVELEAYRHDDEHVRKPLLEIRSRVSSMAHLYDILSYSGEVQEIQLDQYLERMTRSIMDSYLSDHENIELVMSMDAICIDVKRAISLGLITNELITNAAKYAFPDGRRGIITLDLRKKDKCLVFQISDNGAGMPQDFSLDEPSGLGIELVRMLVGQLDGSVEYINKSGSIFRIVIPGVGL